MCIQLVKHKKKVTKDILNIIGNEAAEEQIT